MKKIKKVALFLLMLMIIPVSSLLTGCGATPKNEALGVFFQSTIYDEETGLPVFAVDKGIDTWLAFKVNPSSWSGYTVTYAVKECSAQNLSRFNLDKGIINVGSEKFEDIKIEIKVNGYVDTCIVTLKHYPNSVYVANTDITINALSNYTINPIGVFTDAFGETYEQSLLEYDFNFVVESMDPTIINIPHENRLKLCSVRKNGGKTKVKVKLLNSIGQEKFAFEINVTVVENALKSMALIEGHDSFVNTEESITINASSLEKDGEKYKIGYNAYIFSVHDLLVKDNLVLTATTNSRYARVKDEEKTIYVTKGIDDVQTFKLFIWTNLTELDGNSHSMEVTINVDFTK